jgi:hypothetical protein
LQAWTSCEASHPEESVFYSQQKNLSVVHVYNTYGDWQLVEEFYLQQICLYGLPATNFGNKVKPYTSYFESSFIIKIYLN